MPPDAAFLLRVLEIKGLNFSSSDYWFIMTAKSWIKMLGVTNEVATPLFCYKECKRST